MLAWPTCLCVHYVADGHFKLSSVNASWTSDESIPAYRSTARSVTRAESHTQREREGCTRVGVGVGLGVSPVKVTAGDFLVARTAGGGTLSVCVCVWMSVYVLAALPTANACGAGSRLLGCRRAGEIERRGCGRQTGGFSRLSEDGS